MSRIARGLVVSLLVLFAGATAQAQPFRVDHFNVYRSFGPEPPTGGRVELTDQFGSSAAALGPADFFFVPADKNGELINDRFSHLTCYQIAEPGLPGPPVISTNQFGAQPLTLGVARLLCAPTVKLIAPGEVNIDHYQCYDANGATLSVPAGLRDQFQNQDVRILEPFLFCNPVDKNGEGIQNVDDHLTCYRYTPLGQPVGSVPIQNQFFPNTSELEVAEPGALCVPSQKQVVQPGLDHYNLYRAFASAPQVTGVQLTDQFRSTSTALGPAPFFLVPAEKNGEPLSDPLSHLTCYEIADPAPPGPRVRATNQFGSENLTLGPPRVLCTPTDKLIDPPGPIPLDHYQCYDAFGPPVDVGVAISDQFQVQSAVLADPFLFCNPVDKNGEGITNFDDHLTCYKYTPRGAEVGQVPIVNQFLPDGFVQVLEPFALCVPTQKEVIGIDHFAMYQAEGPEAPPVTVRDQFGFETLDLGKVNRFLVPADKNGEGILDPISHLTCHEIRNGGPAPTQVMVDNQFGRRPLDLGLARDFCLPTEKLITPGTPTIDHFKCYEAFGDPVEFQVDWADQFQGVGVTVLEPILLCNPADKNGEGIVNEEDHLVCYRSEGSVSPVGPVDVVNQFNSGEPIDVLDPFALCVPSLKFLPPKTPGLAGTGLAALGTALALAAMLSLGAWRMRRRS